MLLKESALTILQYVSIKVDLKVELRLFTEYKANRDETPEAIRLAVPYIQQILEAMHIPVVVKEGYEADDIIGTLANKPKKKIIKVLW
jgi:DNA polymerase-1